MADIARVLETLRNWRQPPTGDNPFNLACRLEPGISAVGEVEASFGAEVSGELLTLWTITREAWLFEDVEYGQWGLHLFSPGDSADRTVVERARRPGDFRTDDVVLGEFLGDLALLVRAGSEVGDRRYLIALPLDPREEWPGVGESAALVLTRMLERDGDKFWE